MKLSFLCLKVGNCSFS